MVGRKIKISVILENNPFVDSNAANNRFLTLAEGLSLCGCSIDLIFIKGFKSKQEQCRFKESGAFNNINYRYLIPINLENTIFRKLVTAFYPSQYTIKRIYKIIKSNNYDFVWLGVSPQIIKIGLYLFKCKLGTNFFHERSEYSWIGLAGNKSMHNKYLNYFLPQLDTLAIMTSTLLRYYKKYIGDKTRIIHLPMTVDFSRFNKLFPENKLLKPYIAYCGAMNNAKDGVDILIQSFIKIMDEFPKLYLYLAGPLMPEHDYRLQKSIIAKFNAYDRIIYLGNLTREEIPVFLSNAKVLAMSRPESKQAEGGFPTKLGEYLATGKPVCATTVGEIGNYLKDSKSAFLANPGSVDSFADALKRALISEKSNEIGLAGRDVALEHFNKDIQVKKLYNFLIQNR